MENRADCPLRLSKKLKFVAVGGHAPTTATPTGKFCGKLCARNEVTSARFAAKFCRRGFSKGETDALGVAVRGCCPFCSVSSFSTRCGVPLYGRLVPAAGSRRERCGAARLYRVITASMMLSSTPTCTRQSAVTSWPSASLPPGRRMPRGAPASSASGKTGSRYRPWKP